MIIIRKRIVFSRNDKTKLCIILLSLIVFIASLTQTAFTYDDYDGVKTHSSISLLIMGGIVVVGGGLLEWFIWLANPLYLFGLFYFYTNNRKCIYFLVSASILSLSFTTWNEILAAENGRLATIKSLELGYWLWVISILVSTIAIAIFKIRHKVDK
ncbi:hypothetical protein CLV62_10172 [Dysgonomonas alginatilytica]|uniref:Uncharacterized protein n=1 Tax=Dysgonomonas alginatilytica TaxID=1605892 RepID=A0A2V3PW32_9BACT|nr:hypothetical protein [Dysgonomonas alginatilytica]PXV68808.1 hypothetical protein CLV62_10172 [Dysgonomonas alginatilytica]